MSRRALCAGAAVLLAAGCAGGRGTAPVTPTPASRPVLAGYLFSRSGPYIPSVHADRLTHLIYAFARIDTTCTAAAPERCVAVIGNPCADVGTCPDTVAPAIPGGSFAAITDLKRRYPHLRTLIAFGGWGWSDKFSDAVVSDSSRRTFVASALDRFFAQRPGVFDGIDIDWEYPVNGGALHAVCGPEKPQTCRAEDRRNFTLLLRDLRGALDRRGAREGRHYVLTAAIPAGRGAVSFFELDSVAAVVDWINVMTYDYHGAGRTGFNSPLHTATGDPTATFNIDSTVAMYLAAGVPREKLVIGVPFYGRMYRDVPDTNDGLFQPAPGAVQSVAYHDVGRFLADTSFRRCWHGESRVPWLWSPTRRQWVSYDDTASVREKGEYASRERLGGAMIWQLGSDTTGALLDALHAALAGGTRLGSAGYTGAGRRDSSALARPTHC